MVPEFLKNMLIQDYGVELAEKIIEGYQIKRPLTFRINTLRCEISEILNILERNGVAVEKISWYDGAIVVKNKKEEDIRELKMYDEGKIYFQSLSSMLPPFFLDINDNDQVLDMTAAPGGKTTLISTLANNKAMITACERNKARVERLKYNVLKQGAKKVNVMQIDARDLDDYFSFDSILLDAPCSGSGTLSVYDNSFASFNEELINKSVKTQKELLQKAVNLLKVGSTMIYSTCSVLKKENEDVIKQILEDNENIEIIPLDFSPYPDLPILPVNIEGTMCLYPNELYEGFFIAKIRKKY